VDVIVLQERGRLYRKPLEQLEVAQYLDDLLRREFFQDRGRGLDFAHERLREAVCASLTSPARQVLHGRMVGALEPLVTRCRDTLAELIAPGGPDSNQQRS